MRGLAVVLFVGAIVCSGAPPLALGLIVAAAALVALSKL